MNVGIKLMEANMTKNRGKNTIIVFKGIFIELDMNKNFSGNTIIMTESGKVGNWLAHNVKSLKRARLEDPVFEKQFEVYSNNQVEARYLLTPSFMERLLELVKLYDTSDVQCSFYENKLLIMIDSGREHFVMSSIFHPVTFVEEIKSILSEMSLIFQIIEVLKLDQKTGL